jgi:hypothetical protein
MLVEPLTTKVRCGATQLALHMPTRTGTNSGASLPDTWQWSIDSIFVEWVDNSGVAQKKTWAFKVCGDASRGPFANGSMGAVWVQRAVL